MNLIRRERLDLMCISPHYQRHTSVENPGGKKLFEFTRRPVAQRRVQPLPVVDFFNKAANGLLGRRKRPILLKRYLYSAPRKLDRSLS